MQKTDNRVMEARELRVGNWVEYNGTIMPVTSIGEYGISSETKVCTAHVKFTNMHLSPIPITPEILEAAGFVKDDSGYLDKYRIGGFVLYTDDVRFAYELHNANVPSPEIQYVHQLQNLYFALTGSELPITFKNKI